MRTLRVVLMAVVAAWLAGVPSAAQQFENVPQAQPATQAPAPAGIKVGILNLQRAMASTQEGKKAGEDLRTQFGPREAELQKIADELRDLENQARTQERTLSQEARVQLLRQIEQKRKHGTRAQQDLQEELDSLRNEIFARIGEKLQRVIDRYASENNLSIVFNAVHWSEGGAFVYAAPAVDITEPVIRLYDQTYPVQASTGATPAPAPAGTNRPTQPRKPN